MPKLSRFERLKRHIQREYEERGYSKERAEEIAAATAAKIERMKKEREGSA